MTDISAAAASRSRSRGAAALVIVGGAAAVVAAVTISPHAASHGPTLCPSRLIFGVPCPGCGLTRSWVSFAHGDFAASWSYNWFGPISLVAVAVGVVVFTVAVMARGPDRAMAAGRALLRSRVVAAVVCVWIGYGVVRLVSYLADVHIPGIAQVV